MPLSLVAQGPLGLVQDASVMTVPMADMKMMAWTIMTIALMVKTDGLGIPTAKAGTESH